MNRDPIREEPLREPGESLREKLRDHVLDRMLVWLMLSVVATTLALMEWLRWLFHLPVSPIKATIVAVAIGAFSAWKFRSSRQQLEQLRLGLRGERAVGQYLQGALLPLGYFVLHDICFDDYNIDHVVIGPGGVFAVEVKTRTKPARGGGKIAYQRSTAKCELEIVASKPANAPILGPGVLPFSTLEATRVHVGRGATTSAGLWQ